MVRLLLVGAIIFGILYFVPVQQLVTDEKGEFSFNDVVDDVTERVSSIDFEAMAVHVIDAVDYMAQSLLNLDDREASPTYNPSELEDEGRTTEIDTSDFEAQDLETEVHQLVNQRREEHGLDPLTFSEEVSVVAREKSRDMAINDYFAHESPTYGTPFEMMDQFGLTYRQAGENLAKGQRTAEEVMEGWMNSEGHRKNILHDGFTEIGIGYVKDSHQTYWTQMFIGK
ncbi:putative YkwD family protein [Alkalibacillus flavidus]|uniref:YkwD family protein n=1 Tax=Alkalibacillus flavidus TaxID=546021 RepID=A0ABV2KX82_9BACI